LNIVNQCQDINLISPVHFAYGGKLDVVPDQEIDVNTVMRNRLEFDSEQDILEGILLYKIQRQPAESDVLIQDESKNTQLLVAWHGEYIKGLHVRAVLIEHDKELDQDKLMRLYQKYWYLFDEWASSIRSNWLLCDTTILATTIKAMNGGYRWDIFISKRIRGNVIRPLWLDVGR
jgi:hypothetical protein